MLIQRRYADAAAKSKTSKIARLKEYIAIVSYIKLIDKEVSYSEDEE